jgi:hypothetical protein
MNMLTTTEPYNLALRHWWLIQSGTKPICPYKQGTDERRVYDKQIKRLEGLSNGY